MADLSFTKMQGAGNDFIIIDNRAHVLSEEKIISLAPRLCHRKFGIGADGIIALQAPEQSALDYTMFYRNADGSDAGMCGNGARCLALFASRAGLGNNLEFNVHDTVYKASVDANTGRLTLSFPVKVEVEKTTPDGESLFYRANTGTEHIVREVSASRFDDNEKLCEEGRRLRNHPRYNPPGTNVNFIWGDRPGELKIKTYERGVEDLTLACGTGAIAAAITWHHLYGKDCQRGQIKAEAQGGTLHVDFNYNSGKKLYSDIKLSGEAVFVFKGVIEY